MIQHYQTNGLWVVDIPAAARFEIVPLNGKTQALFQTLRAPAAQINGSLFHNASSPIGTVIYDGVLAHDAGSGYGFGVGRDGPDFGGPWSKAWRGYVSGYPGLIQNGRRMAQSISDPKVFNTPTRRSAVARKGERIFFIASAGNLTLNAFADRLLALGMTEAVNLDGGGSSQLYAGGKCLNRPTDNRKIANVIAVWEGDGAETQNKEDVKLRAIATKKQPVYTASGAVEPGRYIDKGDACEVGSITQNLLISVTYPTGSGPRKAYVRSLEGFTQG